MPRVLSIQRSLVPPPDRERYQQNLRRKRDHYRQANCRFWVFAEVGLPGAFLEFFEAADAETLSRAHAAAPDAVLDPGRIYSEVDVT